MKILRQPVEIFEELTGKRFDNAAKSYPSQIQISWKKIDSGAMLCVSALSFRFEIGMERPLASTTRGHGVR